MIVSMHEKRQVMTVPPILTPMPENIDLMLSIEQALLVVRKFLQTQVGVKNQSRQKSDGSLVTEFDAEAEKRVVAFLRSRYPECSFLAEEAERTPLTEKRSETGLKFIIDPIDGTTNFSIGHPFFCCSIAAEVNGVVVAGGIDVPSLGDTYLSAKDHGSFKNSEPIFVSTQKLLKESVFATGFATHRPKILGQQIKLLSQFLGQSRGFRRSGSAAFDLCLVAEGVLDFYFELDLKPWDIAAGVLLVEEAGGVVCDLGQRQFDLYQPRLLACQPSILNEVQSRLDRQ